MVASIQAAVAHLARLATPLSAAAFETVAAARKAAGVRLDKHAGPSTPAPLFHPPDLAAAAGAPALAPALATAFGITSATPVQAQGIPLMLAGREVLAVAPTGSGKTLAYGLPLLVRAALARREGALGGRGGGVTGVVLAPTRELVEQIGDVLTRAVGARFLFAGGRGDAGKLLALRTLLASGGLAPPALVFVETQARATAVLAELAAAAAACPAASRLTMDVLHGGRPQAERSAAVRRYRTGEVSVLVATDVLGRGLDCPATRTVLSFDAPSSPAAYVHRMGRTGRCGGVAGTAITLFTEADGPGLGRLATVAAAGGATIPDWMRALGGGGGGSRARERVTRPVWRRSLTAGPRRPTLRPVVDGGESSEDAADA
ncbi:hypothetical protein I4F81_001302 [Pyropia yezoensis]|uniref:Uncharacterized protein n=1 Tax=Pyropia yezoensis TaxID=2788 RepID=A0ACC3BLT6_PYRYE|nr:hypothetical protein I4F81_001302 [Neopyropia yezoensis]